eukprot:scaffold407_cov66-Phaeocystis_antarctica.AAC.3
MARVPRRERNYKQRAGPQITPFIRLQCSYMMQRAMPQRAGFVRKLTTLAHEELGGLLAPLYAALGDSIDAGVPSCVKPRRLPLRARNLPTRGRRLHSWLR